MVDRSLWRSHSGNWIMKYANAKVAGSLLFVGGVQCVLGIIISEALYPGYRGEECVNRAPNVDVSSC